MNRIFKHKRHQLMQEGKMKRVALYAIGEIILVVIGILIAVSINNWNSRRIYMQEEAKTLSSLQTDLNRDFKRFNFLDSALSKRIERCDSALILLKSSQIEDRLKGLDVNFLSYFLIEPNSITYDEMINTGRLYSIGNEQLRTKIIEYYRQVEKWSKYREKDNDQVRQAEMNPSLNETVLIRRMLFTQEEFDLTRFPWLANENSTQMDDYQALVILARGNFRELRNTIRFLRDVFCQDVLDSLEENEVD